MRQFKLFIYTLTLTAALALAAAPAISQPNPPGPPPGTPPGDPGGGNNPHNRVPFTGLELLVLAGGLLGFRKIRQLKENK